MFMCTFFSKQKQISLKVLTPTKSDQIKWKDMESLFIINIKYKRSVT
jgi:hypothetical protein